MSHMSRI